MNHSDHQKIWDNLSTVNRLILVNVIIFCFQYLASLSSTRLELIFGLVPAYAVAKMMLWQFVTYIFLHGGMLHLLFNMFSLWVFGRELELIWGKQEFIKFYLICGFGAGLLTWITGYDSLVPTIGASGAVLGILTAYSLTFPNRYIYIYLFIPIKAKYLAIIFAVLEFMQGLQYTSDGIAHFAHLGGIFTAVLYLKVTFHHFNWPDFKPHYNDYRKKRLYQIHKKREQEIRELKHQVDIILDKISEQGINTLSRNEKKLLKKASIIIKKENKSD